MHHYCSILVIVLHPFGRVTNLQIFKTVICLNGRDIWSTGRIPLITEREKDSSKLKEKILARRETRRDAWKKEISRIYRKTALRSHCTSKPTVKVKRKEGNFLSRFSVYPTAILSRLVSYFTLLLFSFFWFVFQHQEIVQVYRKPDIRGKCLFTWGNHLMRGHSMCKNYVTSQEKGSLVH